MLGVLGLFGFAAAELSATGSAATKQPNILMKILGSLGKLDIKPTLEGKSWTEMTIRERFTVYNWTFELCVLAFIVFYVSAYLNGRRHNLGKVTRFISVVNPVLDANFSVLGCKTAQPVIKDSDSRYTYYASGRVNTESMLMRFRLKDRQNFLNYMLGFFVPSLSSEDGLGDHIEIDLTPIDPAACESGIFAVVNKANLAEVNTDLYYSKLAKFIDNDQLPQNYMFLLEHPEQVSALYIEELKRAVDHPSSKNVLRFLSFSDVPTVEPLKESDVTGNRKVHLSLRFPNTADEEDAVVKIMEAVLKFLDKLTCKPRYSHSVLKRVSAAREAEYARIRKTIEMARKEELELKKAEERREAARKASLLSEEEQLRLKVKEQTKQARKQKKKMTRRA